MPIIYKNIMTQKTQMTTGRNTIMCPVIRSIRSRNWAFTWNNYNKKNIDTLTHLFSSDPKILKWIFQEETGENGTPHLQGTVAYRNAVTLNSLKKINKSIHWERCRNLAASLNYCRKKESRTGEIYQSDNIKTEEIYVSITKPNEFPIKFILNDMRKQMMKDWRKIDVDQKIWEDVRQK